MLLPQEIFVFVTSMYGLNIQEKNKVDVARHITPKGVLGNIFSDTSLLYLYSSYDSSYDEHKKKHCITLRRPTEPHPTHFPLCLQSTTVCVLYEIIQVVFFAKVMRLSSSRGAIIFIKKYVFPCLQICLQKSSNDFG